MYKKIVLLIGAAAIIWSLMNPITYTQNVKTGTTKPSDSGFLFQTSQPIYNEVIKTDTYKTNSRTFSIIVGTLVLWYLVPIGKKEEKDL